MKNNIKLLSAVVLFTISGKLANAQSHTRTVTINNKPVPMWNVPAISAQDSARFMNDLGQFSDIWRVDYIRAGLNPTELAEFNVNLRYMREELIAMSRRIQNVLRQTKQDFVERHNLCQGEIQMLVNQINSIGGELESMEASYDNFINQMFIKIIQRQYD